MILDTVLDGANGVGRVRQAPALEVPVYPEEVAPRLGGENPRSGRCLS